jgi:two-component system chemotaxis sensor kinase CheA
VQGVSIDRVIERLERIALVQDDLAGAARFGRRQVDVLREARAELLDALRLLGPPRPWGPPAAALGCIDRIARRLAGLAEDADQSSQACRSGAERLLGATRDIRQEISHARRTTLSHMLGRVATGIERLATREGRSLRVLVDAPDVPVDREIAERLIDPLMQLARNALAHGIEREDERLARGKNPTGSIMLSGERVGDTLRIACEDDGRGVDIDEVRRLAVERGLIGAEAARSADDDDLLALLFVPGITTRADADLLAGRGVGLDLALSMVRRLGGAIRLHRREGSGLSAIIDVPSERWMTDVLWVHAGPWELAIPVAFTGKLSHADRARPSVHLARCLGAPVHEPGPLSLELALGGAPIVSVGVDAVGDVEECSLRPLPALIASAGPFSAAILRGDGTLRLTLDAALVAVRAWALA